MRSHEWHQLYVCVIRASSLVMSLKYNSASHVDYFKCFLIVIPILWIKSENFSVIYVSSIESSNLVNCGTTFLPSPHLWKATLRPFVIMESLSLGIHFLLCHIFTLCTIWLSSQDCSLYLSPLFSGLDTVTYLPIPAQGSHPTSSMYSLHMYILYVWHLSLSSQVKSVVFQPLGWSNSWYWLLNTCLFICFLSYPMSTGFEGGASALSETLMTNEEMLLGWISE